MEADPEYSPLELPYPLPQSASAYILVFYTWGEEKYTFAAEQWLWYLSSWKKKKRSDCEKRKGQ